MSIKVSEDVQQILDEADRKEQRKKANEYDQSMGSIMSRYQQALRIQR
jgi:hypothetical protein